MSNNTITLFCLIDGATAFHVFPVKIPSSDTIGDLKDLIKVKKAPRLDDVAAAELTLWRTSFHDGNPDSVIKIYALGDKTELKNPRTRLSNLFPESPDDTTYIIVQRPLSASPTQQKFVPTDHLDKELAVILQQVGHHHITRPIDPNHVEASQREILGPFYKRTLPYHKQAKIPSLVMLGISQLDKQAKTNDDDDTKKNETLRSIVQADICNLDDQRVVAMVAPSGSGKTATVIDLASQHFVIYCVCCYSESVDIPDFKDTNFVKLADDVENIYSGVVNDMPRTLRSPVEIDSEVIPLVRGRVKLEFLARLLFLQLLLSNNPALEPFQFFREQTSGQASALTIRKLVVKLKQYRHVVIEGMLEVAQTQIRSCLVPRKLGLVIALDEAQVANGILLKRLISPFILLKNLDNLGNLFDRNNQIKYEFRCGFLTPLCGALSQMQATLVILGTALSLQSAEQVYSAVGKDTKFTRIIDFPCFNEIEVCKMLSDLVDMSGCDIPPAILTQLSGRARFSIGIVKHLMLTGSLQGSKQAILNNAIRRHIKLVKAKLREGVQWVISADQTGESVRLLCRMVLGYRLQGSKISFSSKQQSDFVDNALCRLRPHPDGMHMIMDEPMVIESVEEELQARGKDSILTEHLKQLNRVVINLGLTSAAKGALLEPLVRRSLQHFNGYHLADLPFLQDIALPQWCDGLQLQIDDVNTANGFGYAAKGVAADLAFFQDSPPNKMLVPHSDTRPDGLWFFPDKQYAGSLAIKFYSNPLSRTTHNANETSSDIRCCFLQKDGLTANSPFTKIQESFTNLKGILRIHLEFPYTQQSRPNTCVYRNLETGTEDIMVHIDVLNIDSFFDEGVTENRDDMIQLKKLIKYVCM